MVIALTISLEGEKNLKGRIYYMDSELCVQNAVNEVTEQLSNCSLKDMNEHKMRGRIWKITKKAKLESLILVYPSVPLYKRPLS